MVDSLYGERMSDDLEDLRREREQSEGVETAEDEDLEKNYLNSPHHTWGI